jgi:SAM-dependent methyltransferase
MVDVLTFRNARLAPGFSGGQALVVRRTLISRAKLPWVRPKDASDFLNISRVLKRFAPQGFGFAIAPGLRPIKQSAAERAKLLRTIFGEIRPCVFAVQLAIMLSIIAAAVLGGPLGAVALLVYMAQPLIAIVGSPIRPGDLWWSVLLALPLRLWDWIATVAAAGPDFERRAKVQSRRTRYLADISSGLERFFETRRTTCYVCGGTALSVYRRAPDLLQHKPGRFTLERCGECSHIQQNPRLSLAGLEFYYRDFYDGLGESWTETVFGFTSAAYLSRARALADSRPKRWLDVGGGYGHFCLAARDVLPETRFECLDMGVSVEEAVQRGWADAGHRGVLPELANHLSDQFDAASLSHCLEHTRDPRREIAAAWGVLKPGGALLIEVPDPECIWRHALGRLWLPFFQPQHQHLLSVKNLCQLLEAQGFHIEKVQRGDAHMGSDFFIAVFLLLDRIAPADEPWRSPQSRIGALWRSLAWSLGTPLFLVASLIDGLIRRFRAVPGFSNAYRVLARVSAAKMEAPKKLSA